MKIIPLNKIINDRYKPVRIDEGKFKNFQKSLKEFYQTTKSAALEEPNKTRITKFIQDLYYTSDNGYEVVPVDNIDLAITKNSIPRVLIEVKKPSERKDMVQIGKLNVKAFQELILYYLKEVAPIDKYGKEQLGNNQIENIIITNNYEWFIIDAQDFKYIANISEIKKHYKLHMRNPSTSDFYKRVETELNKPDNQHKLKNLKVVHLDFRNTYSKRDLSYIYKLFTPRHLLKEYGDNDSNILNKKFYNELLHIIGLEEVGKSKKLIQRKANPDSGSLLENTIRKLETEFTLTDSTELFEKALELNITWLNRVLFLKLLDAHLHTIHKDKYTKFIDEDKITSFDTLNTLFFEVLAIKPEERHEDIIKQFGNIPYLNSALFESTELEQEYLRISGLNDDIVLKVYTPTKTELKGTEATLKYFLTFLNSYDFTSDSSKIIEDNTKNLINASVLGLIFEKLNGYKDGSFFTPSFITSYMTKTTLRKMVIAKLNATFELNADTIDSLYSSLKDKRNTEGRKQINTVIDTITILDPAVGSGHFLVSALNELLVIKSELDIIDGMSSYSISNENDELLIMDKEDEVFKYHINKRGVIPSTKQTIQKIIFHEKQRIIEKQLFGVDININSVKITQLRLWIELLKHSYYNEDEGFDNLLDEGNLVTLPNIDINIKCGNSLVSRFALNDSDNDEKETKKLLKKILPKYKEAVLNYKKENNKDNKKLIKETIDVMQNEFRKVLVDTGRFMQLLRNYIFQYNNEGLDKELAILALEKNVTMTQPRFSFGDESPMIDAKKREKAYNKLRKEFQKQKNIKESKFFEDSFEWRFRFPEVLDENGDFLGFDIVIGNPPYGAELDNNTKSFYKEKYSNVHMRTIDTFNYFISMSSTLLRDNAYLNFIIPNNFLYQNEYEKTRQYLLENFQIEEAINLGDNIFEDASVPTCIIEFKNSKKEDYNFKYSDIRDSKDKMKTLSELECEPYSKELILGIPSYIFGINPMTAKLIDKIKEKSYLIDDIALEVASGISTGGDKIFRVSQELVIEKELEVDTLENILVGREINKYEINDSQHKLIYSPRDIKMEKYPNVLKYLEPFRDKLMERSESKKGILPWYSLGRHRYKELFTEDKILLRQTADSIIATYDNEKYFALNSLLIFKINPQYKIDYKFATAILNSKLTTFIYRNYTGEEGRGFAEVKPKNVRKLFIPKADKEMQDKFVAIVDTIIELKKNNQETSELEKSIDFVIYELYNLNEDEIELIEES